MHVKCFALGISNIKLGIMKRTNKQTNKQNIKQTYFSVIPLAFFLITYNKFVSFKINGKNSTLLSLLKL